MSRAKTERLLNLVICLLAARRYLSREEIRRAVPGYPDGEEAFERAFERDKDELREMGVPVETGTNSPLFDDEVGYRIRRDAYALPEIHFTAEELSVLGLAARAWQSGALAGAASRALLKLRTQEPAALAGTPGPGEGGLEPPEPGPDLAAATSMPGLDPRVEGSEAAFAPLWDALAQRRPVRFEYRRRGAAGTEARHVEPWGLVARQGRWYLVGHDRSRGERRVFRINRIAGAVTPTGRTGEAAVPSGVDLAAEVAAFAPAGPAGLAQVALAPGAGGFLRRRATAMQTDALSEVPSGWDVICVPYAEAEQVAADVAGLGTSAVVLGPPDVRSAVVARLQAVAATTPRPAPVPA